MSIERLTAEDSVMLWPDEVWPQDIGALAILDGGNLLDPDGRFRIEAVREAVASRLHLVPRFRQLLYEPPPRLGGPLWVDDQAFDLSHHVSVVQLSAPADEAQLLLATEQLRRRRLDRSRPLWEMWFLTGMANQRVGMFVRTHHTMADGIAGVAALASFLDIAPDTGLARAEPWAPAREPAEADLLADNIERRRDARRRMLSKLVHPVASLRNIALAWPALHELFAEPALPSTSLDRVVGPDRTIALVRGSLEEVKAVAKTHAAKVNDVLLTVIAGGLRTLLCSRGEPVEGVVLRIYVPVSLRHGQYAGARGNSIAQMVVPLPIGLSDPVKRLQQLTAETARRKARTRPSVGGLPTRGFAGRAMLKLIERQRVNVESADLPGPPVPLYLAGARVLEIFPLLPLIGKVSLGIGALSYAGQFNIAAVADRDAYPDIGIFAAGLRDDLDSLDLKLHSPAVA
ncbi:MAG TPA: wax ester/triacylglycerol synthase family O-acyltransferase [Candidatus Dormibacteraeota bacterium]